MRILKLTFLTGMLLVLASTACAPQTTTATSQPAASEAAAAPAQPEVTTPATLVPINLAGPEMQVGSTWPYADGTTLVAVPGGEFTMGHGGFDNPEHQVTLPDFWAYSTEVTNQQFARCVAAGQCEPPNTTDDPGYIDFAGFNNPATGVTYDQAVSYCTFVHGRLPTEAEWEKLARGPNGNIYPWGDNAPACDLLNMDGCVGDTSPVTDYPPGVSYYGAFDMEGNTFEWVADKYQPDYYLNSPAENPQGPDVGAERSVRSSAFNSGANQTQAFSRFHTRPEDHRANLGFRCVVEDPTYFAAFCALISQYGIAPGGSPNPSQNIQVQCPTLGISETLGHCDTKQTQVTMSSTASEQNTHVDIQPPGGCSAPNGSFPGNKGSLCTVQNTNITMKASCDYSNLGSATCPKHYNLDANSGMCVWDGTTVSGRACLPGLTYDPAMQCCAIDNPTAGNFPLCQVGSTIVNLKNGKYGCLGNKVSMPDQIKSLKVNLPGACGSSGGSGCQPPAGGCGYKASWDAKNCCCRSIFGGCN